MKKLSKQELKGVMGGSTSCTSSCGCSITACNGTATCTPTYCSCQGLTGTLNKPCVIPP